MDKIIDLVLSYPDAVMAMLFAVPFAAAQIAAIFHLEWLAAAAPRIYTAVQFIGGNWGKAANAARLLQIYRRDGGLAALAELERLAGGTPPAAGPPSGTGSTLPALAVLAVGLPLLGACSGQVDRVAVADAAGDLAALTAEHFRAAELVRDKTGLSPAEQCRLAAGGADLAVAFGLSDPAVLAAEQAFLKGYCLPPF